MTKIKICGLSRECDIEAANELKPDYIGFVFAKTSKRYVSPDRARELKSLLCNDVSAVGVFVDEAPEKVAQLLEEGTIDAAQLHGSEDEEYIQKLRKMSSKPIIKAFKVKSAEDIEKCLASSADYILLDSGAGGGRTFDWRILSKTERPYFLAGGLSDENVSEATLRYSPFAVDVSSGVEADGLKDKEKMRRFVSLVRNIDIAGPKRAREVQDD